MQLFYIDIQLFADKDEKTEKATQKRRRDSRQEGQVLQSREIKSALTILFAFFSLKFIGGYMYEQLVVFTRQTFIHYTIQTNLLAEDNIMPFAIEILLLLFKIMAPFFGVVVIVALVSSYMQVGFLFTTKPLKPKLEKINPLKGLKRMFSVNSLVELVKSIFKIVVAGLVGYYYILGQIPSIMQLLDQQVGQIVIFIANLVLNLALRMGVALVILGVVDYLFQWKKYEKDLMMTKHEVKEEHKQVDGNPQIKSKIRQKQRESSVRRMMTEVPKADVIITNPTHYAVAIKYDTEIADAPIVVAKGQDYVALRIKEIGKEHHIEIVENKPLARSLFDAAQIGEQIPPDLFQAVAEVLAFVYSMK